MMVQSAKTVRTVFLPEFSRSALFIRSNFQQTVPGLPAVNETVASPVALYKLCVQQHMKTLAINVNLMPSSTESYRVSCSRHHGRFANTPTGLCQFSIAIERIEKRWTVQSYSNFIHNHGAAPERLADPEWLPQIRNSDAREALGLRPISSSKTVSLQLSRYLMAGSLSIVIADETLSTTGGAAKEAQVVKQGGNRSPESQRERRDAEEEEKEAFSRHTDSIFLPQSTKLSFSRCFRSTLSLSSTSCPSSSSSGDFPATEHTSTSSSNPACHSRSRSRLLLDPYTSYCNPSISSHHSCSI